MRKRRVLFFAEAVTLAHAARPVVLAKMLDPARYDVHLAWSPRYAHLFGPLPFAVHTIQSMASEVFLGHLQRGSPVFDFPTLRAYAVEDIALMERIDPDVVVGDFRLSLAASAPALGKPYVALINAYWSPHARPRYTVPELPLNALLGVRASQAVFDLVRPLAFAWHTVPLNRLRRVYGLPGLGRDLPTLYAWADRTLYPDLPETAPTFGIPSSHRYLGPLLWSPACPLPDWWDRLPENRPRIYLTLGSSGAARRLPRIIDALGTLPVTVMVATAGAAGSLPRPANVYAADYLPGLEASQRADLVICNGGSPTTQQALAAGVPVLGIPRNLDQHLNTDCLEQAGLGLGLRSDALRAGALRQAVACLLEDDAFRLKARAIGKKMAAYPTAEVFEGVLGGLVR
ncbi:glycosyltransferase [Methylomagnum sp.]